MSEEKTTICKHAVTGIQIKCDIDDSVCIYQRWCVDRMKFVPLLSASNCPRRNYKMEENEIQKVEEQPIAAPVVQQPKSKKTECRVILVTNNMIGIDFNGYGISLPKTNVLSSIKVGDTVKVKYVSEIGKEDFDCFII